MKHLYSNKNLNFQLGLISDYNRKQENILLKTKTSSTKQKKKSLKLYEHDIEYYDTFLKSLKEDNISPIKNTIKITRRKKSKTLKISQIEENNIRMNLNENNKKIKNLMRKSLLKKKNNLFDSNNQKSYSSSNLIKVDHSFQMINNIQFLIESKKKQSFSSFKKKNNNNKENKENKSFELSNDNITLIDNPDLFLTYNNQIRHLEKILGKNKCLIKRKTHSYSKMDDEKRKKIINNFNIKKIIPIQSNFISNATKISFSKKNSKEKLKEEKKENDDETQKNTQIITSYQFDDKSNKKKKFIFCGCLSIKG